MPEETKHFYEFGAFRLDAVERLLLREDKPVALTPKVFDTLLLLVQTNGRLVEKGFLMKQLWADSFVEESNLTYNISVLRKALGDTAANHQFIETVSGRGYRFAAEVKEVWEPPEGAALPMQAMPAPVLRNTKSKVTTAAALVVVLSGVLIFWTATRSKSTTDSRPISTVKSIAVLPFELLGAEKNSEAEYLSDGISESLINSLSQLPGLKVIARGSTFRYKGKEADPQEVARALDVEAILTGRVLQRGEQLQISVELMDARDKTQMWGEQYNHKMADLLFVQAEISREIAEKLRLKLTNAEQQQLARRETADPQAYEWLLNGRFYQTKGGTENLKRAVECYQQAIAIDPAYARAYAELSIGYMSLVVPGIVDPKEFTPKAEAAAHKAAELDESLAEAHLALAWIKLHSWDWMAAEREFNRAFELNPNHSMAHRRYSYYLSIMGRHDEAIAEAKRARELDPLSPNILWNFGYQLLLARQNDQTIEAAKELLELDQNQSGAYALLAYAYEAKGQYPEAIAAYKQAIKLGNQSSDLQIYFGATYALAGEREKARLILKQLEARKYVSPGALAALYIALGEREKAFASLERGYAEHDNQLRILGIDPNYDPLRSDPRFQDLLRRVGLTP